MVLRDCGNSNGRGRLTGSPLRMVTVAENLQENHSRKGSVGIPLKGELIIAKRSVIPNKKFDRHFLQHWGTKVKTWSSRWDVSEEFPEYLGDKAGSHDLMTTSVCHGQTSPHLEHSLLTTGAKEEFGLWKCSPNFQLPSCFFSPSVRHRRGSIHRNYSMGTNTAQTSW